MKNLSRRQFLASVGPLAIIPFYRENPDIILYNANIITVNSKQPKAEAIAIINDKIVAIGNNDSILRLASGFTKKINIEGKTITPGFIDSHSHPASSGRSHLRNVDCDLRSIEEIKSAIDDAVKTWLPYITISDVSVNQDMTNPNLISVRIKFSTTLDPENLETLTLPFNTTPG